MTPATILAWAAPAVAAVVGTQTAIWWAERRRYEAWQIRDRRWDLMWKLNEARNNPRRLDIEARTRAHRARLDAAWARRLGGRPPRR